MKRLISGVVLLGLLGFSVWSKLPYYFIAFGVACLGLALWEFYALAERVGFNCYKFLAYCTSAIIIYAFIINKLILVIPACVALLLAMMIATLFETKESDFDKVMGSVAATLFGVFYVIVLAGFLIGVRVIDSGPQFTHPIAAPPAYFSSKLLSLFFLIITASDAGAYYAGRTFGKHKLAPTISPGKTIEGSIGGLIAALIAATIVKYSFFPEIPLSHALILAPLMNIVGQMGDLFESMLKRGSKAKDAASIIPGHGGLLDRLDSVLFNAPILYYYCYIFTKRQF